MNEIFEVKRNKIFYEYNGCQCEDVDDVLSFKGVITCPDYERHIIGFSTIKKIVTIGSTKILTNFILINLTYLIGMSILLTILK